MSAALDDAIREALAVADRRRGLRTKLRLALAQGDDAAALALARELVGEDDAAASDRAAPRLERGASRA